MKRVTETRNPDALEFMWHEESSKYVYYGKVIDYFAYGDGSRFVLEYKENLRRVFKTFRTTTEMKRHILYKEYGIC